MKVSPTGSLDMYGVSGTARRFVNVPAAWCILSDAEVLDTFECGCAPWAGWPPAGTPGNRRPGGRKVRAPQDTVVDNVHRPQGQGKCHRKHTAGLWPVR